MAIGAPFGQAGAGGQVAVFRRNAGAWDLEAGLSMPTGTFGFDVALDGDTLVAGAPNASAGGFADGAAFVYERAGSTWSLQQRLTNTVPAGGDFGHAVACFGDRIAVGARNDEGGRVLTFTRSGTAWSFEQKIASSDSPAQDQSFGESVALFGDQLAVGDPRWTDTPQVLRGAAYLFEWNGMSWREHARVQSPMTGEQLFARRIDLGPSVFCVRDGFNSELSAIIYAVGSEQGDPFCSAQPNSLGQVATLTPLGSSSVARNDLLLGVEHGVPGAFGVVLYGTQQTSLPLGSGTRCVEPVTTLVPAGRFSSAGTLLTSLDFGVDPLLTDITSMVPVTMNFQVWYRDGQQSNLSDAREIQFAP